MKYNKKILTNTFESVIFVIRDTKATIIARILQALVLEKDK